MRMIGDRRATLRLQDMWDSGIAGLANDFKIGCKRALYSVTRSGRGGASGWAKQSTGEVKGMLRTSS